MIRRANLSTYKAIQATGVLSFKRMMVYDYLYRNGPLTGGQLQKALGGGVSESIRNRVTELVKMGVAYEVKEAKCPITGRNVMLFDVTENMPKEYVAPKTKNQIIKEHEEYILKLETLIKDMSDHCLCERSTKGFDYHQIHSKMGKSKNGRWLTPNDLLENRIGFVWTYEKQGGCCNSWKNYKFKFLKQKEGFV